MSRFLPITIILRTFFFICCFLPLNLNAQNVEPDELSYQQLKKDWWKIFPDGNRNVGGPKFFDYTLKNSRNVEEFTSLNRLFCPVSGSLISPKSTPELVYVDEEGSSRKICGQLYRCCWPCSCDVMKHVTAEKFSLQIGDQKDEFFLLKIKNPCTKENFPAEVTRSYFCKGDQVNDSSVHFSSEKITVGILHDAHVCSTEEIAYIDEQLITGKYCPLRNNTPVSEIKGGMGDIFIKLAQ